MNTPSALPLNEIYQHYLDVYFHPTKLSEPPHTRSELERALKLRPSLPENLDDAASWLEGFAPAWLRSEAEAEPFPQNHQANEHWRATQRSAQEQRETTLRKLVVGAEEAGNSNCRFDR